LRKWSGEVAPPVFVFLVINLGVTLLSILLSSPTAQIGSLRPLGTILPKLGELAFVGVGLGFVSSITRQHLDLVLISLSAAFVALMDLDHLPSVFGLAEPIRPAHSIGFFFLIVAALSVFIKKQPEVELTFAASFFGHLAADTGIYAPLAPLSFEYVPLEGYMLPFAVGAVVFALIAGLVRRRKQERGTLPSEAN
jgi:hypothetical protein